MSRTELSIQVLGRRLGWFQCRLSSEIASPPPRSHFLGLQDGDIITVWIGVETVLHCQVWRAVIIDDGVEWQKAKWGDDIDGRRLVITPGGRHSLVAVKTFRKRYERASGFRIV